MAYESGSINVNQLLFEMARYNFSNFSVRNFNIEIDKNPDISLLKVKTFMNYDEAYIYLHKLINNKDMATKLDGLKLFIISEENMVKLSKGMSFADYFDFYNNVFDRVGKLNLDENILNEPEIDIKTPDDIYESEDRGKEYIENEDDNYIF